MSTAYCKQSQCLLPAAEEHVDESQGHPFSCKYAAHHKRWDCLQYAVDNKCPGWEYYAENYAEHLT